MAPVGYNFNANKPGYRSKDSGGKQRRIIIFSFLTISLLVILYFWGSSSKEEKEAEAPKSKYISLAPTPSQFKNQASSIAEGKIPEYTTVVDTKSFPQMEVVFNKAEAAYSREEYGLARKYCYQLLDSRIVPDANPLWQKTVRLLGAANTKVLFSDYPFPEKKINYHVKANDGLRKIAMKHNTSVEAVQRSNNMKLTDFNVQLGKTFNIYTGKWSIVISKSRRKLYLFDGKQLFKVYGIGIGKQGRTPTGVFKTGGKRKKPDWYSPEGRIPYGNPKNVLGTRWIRLIPNGKTSREVSGLGIHGTWDPSSIGKAESNGCLRLLNKNVEELFAILPNERKPVPVTIIK
jgi:lipoprotein-anchoring transpeptidase ErfK/SrfK